MTLTFTTSDVSVVPLAQTVPSYRFHNLGYFCRYSLISKFWKLSIYRARLKGGRSRSPGLVNFAPPIAYYYDFSLPAAFTQPGAHLLTEHCAAVSQCLRAASLNSSHRVSSSISLLIRSDCDPLIRSNRVLEKPRGRQEIMAIKRRLSSSYLPLFSLVFTYDG